MTTALIPFNEMQALANSVVKSNMFGIKSPEAALALMAIAQAEGRHPGIVARDYHIISNKPTLKADAMLARFLDSDGKVEWHSYTDEKADATFTHPRGGSVRVEWDMKRAKQAELGGNGMWKKYPRQMLRARVISEGIRTVCPGVVVGMYTPEEVQDFEPQKKENVIEATFTHVAEPIAPVVKEPAKPHTIAIPMLADNSGSDWMAFGTEYAAALKSATTGAELEAWIILNAVGLGSLASAATKLHARILSIIAERREALKTTVQVDDALAIPDFLVRKEERLAEAAE